MQMRAAPPRQDTAFSRQLGGIEQEAHGFADRLPDLLLEADRIASTVAHGIHGRRRAGPGETFWQFRPYSSTDSAQSIDWRRSASSDALFVREREWEAAHTLWLWSDLSASMDFKSHLSKVTKRDRALVLMLAAAELLVRSGERVALLGVTQPSTNRRIAARLAEAIVQAAATGNAGLMASLPPLIPLPRFSGAILVSDFLEPLDEVSARLEVLASNGVEGHIVQVLDPAEETLPYAGRTEFVASEDGARWLVERAETLREAYIEKFLAHRAALEEITHRLGWSFLVHHTDRSPAEALLALVSRLQGHEARGVT